MSYIVLLHPKAARELQELQKSIKIKVKESLKELSDEPEKKGKLLVGSKFWSLRVGDYRAIYEVNQGKMQVIVLFIGNRKNVYDDFSKIF